jgi:hypothetical protein
MTIIRTPFCTPVALDDIPAIYPSPRLPAVPLRWSASTLKSTRELGRISICASTPPSLALHLIRTRIQDRDHLPITGGDKTTHTHQQVSSPLILLLPQRIITCERWVCPRKQSPDWASEIQERETQFSACPVTIDIGSSTRG